MPGPSYVRGRDASFEASRHLSVVVAREVVRREAVEVDVAQVGVAVRAVRGEDAVGVPLALGLLRRLDRDVAVLRKTGSGGDELSDDDVLLEADERVALALHGRLREDAGGLLERRGRQPRLRRERRLRDSHQLRATRRGALALGHGLAVDLLVALEVHQLTREQGRVG